MFKKLIFMSFLALSLGACKNDSATKASQEKLFEEVMAIHNDVMPKMSELNRLKSQVKDYLGSVPEDNVALKDSLLNTFMLLSKSEDGMDDWMKNFKTPSEDAKHEEVIQYLTAQKDSIRMVSDDIYKSMAIAKGLLKSAPSTNAPKSE